MEQDAQRVVIWSARNRFHHSDAASCGGAAARRRASGPVAGRGHPLIVVALTARCHHGPMSVRSVYRLRVLLALALSGVLLLGMTTPAQAASTTFRSDRTAGVPENDMRRVHVVNGQRALSATFTMRNLRPAARSKVELVYTPRGADFPFVVRMHKTAQGDKRRQLWVSDGAHTLTDRLRCPRLGGTWNHRRNTITMRVPQMCFPQNARVAQVKAMAGFFGTGFSAGDYTPFRRVARG